MLTRRARVVASVVGGLAFAGLALPAAPAFAAGVTGPAFYVNHQLYRTVGTPTDFSRTGAPMDSFDTIYNFGGVQMNVATAAPGDPGFNGGRWQVHALSFPHGYAQALAAGDQDGNGVLDATTEVAAALSSGAAVDLGVVKSFECPVIHVSHS